MMGDRANRPCSSVISGWRKTPPDGTPMRVIRLAAPRRRNVVRQPGGIIRIVDQHRKTLLLCQRLALDLPVDVYVSVANLDRFARQTDDPFHVDPSRSVRTAKGRHFPSSRGTEAPDGLVDQESIAGNLRLGRQSMLR